MVPCDAVLEVITKLFLLFLIFLYKNGKFQILNKLTFSFIYISVYKYIYFKPLDFVFHILKYFLFT